jgi:DNA-binding NtrC family response regulator
MRVLICDDEPMLCECLCASLQMRGHSSVSAASVSEARPMLPYVDGVICDGLGGRWMDLLHDVKKSQPFVLYTGDSEMVDDAKSIGIQAFLKGEVKIDTLLAALRLEVAA